MKRDYKDGISDNVTFFVGKEVEHTPLYGKKTLFVVGCQEARVIVGEAISNDCVNIYLGANKCFSKAVDAVLVNEVVNFAGDIGISVTLDFPAHLWDFVLANVYPATHLYLNVSVELPSERTFPNVCVKVDDIDFKATNEGVYVFDLNTSDDLFTSWDEYSKDVIL